MKFSLLKQALRPLLGIGVLAWIVQQLDTARLTELVKQIDWSWFFFGFICLLASNFFSAHRWSRIAGLLEIPLPLPLAVRLYAQGITANTVLPGGIIGGDIWRTAALARRGTTKTLAGLSVLLCRMSGVWVLGICSLVALMIIFAQDRVPESISIPGVITYSGALFCLSGLPVIFIWIKSLRTHLLYTTFSVSLLVQILALLAFWACFKALGLTIPVFLFVAVCAGIFLSAALPASIGGFGAREVGAVVLMTPIGVTTEVSFAGSVLYGLMASIQGLMSVYWWLQRDYR